MANRLLSILCAIINLFSTLAQETLQVKDITFVILSQSNKYHFETANSLKEDIFQQASNLHQSHPSVYLSHSDFASIGEWTFFPFIPNLYEASKDIPWVLIIEERTRIRLNLLLKTLSKYDHKKKLWIGYGLQDISPTIIHHFRDNEFPYPHLGAGIAISNPLLKNLSQRISKADFSADFNIDKSFEFTLFAWNNNNGTLLTHDEAFCPDDSNLSCATYTEEFDTCGPSLTTNNVYIAVKTCEKFHKIRIPVVAETWAKNVENLEYISDSADDNIPTISLGVPNTESGHCGKTLEILKYSYKKTFKDDFIQWIVITDDDTILSVTRLLEVLTCYDPDDDIALGERYGYNVHNNKGFNYITGGGGMLFSKPLVKKLVNFCKCPSISSPDDMILGRCIEELGISIIHSYLFHQARPMDYSPDFLKSDKHISFHKHWNIDPIEVYNEWFFEADAKLSNNLNIKTEL